MYSRLVKTRLTKSTGGEQVDELALGTIVGIYVLEVDLIAESCLQPIREGLVALSDVSPVGITIDRLWPAAIAQRGEVLSWK